MNFLNQKYKDFDVDMPPKRFDPFQQSQSVSQALKSTSKINGNGDVADPIYPSINSPEPANLIDSSGKHPILLDSFNYMYYFSKLVNGVTYYRCKTATNKKLFCTGTAVVKNGMILYTKSHNHLADPIRASNFKRRAKLRAKVVANPKVTTDSVLVDWVSGYKTTMEAAAGPTKHNLIRQVQRIKKNVMQRPGIPSGRIISFLLLKKLFFISSKCFLYILLQITLTQKFHMFMQFDKQNLFS